MFASVPAVDGFLLLACFLNPHQQGRCQLVVPALLPGKFGFGVDQLAVEYTRQDGLGQPLGHLLGPPMTFALFVF